MYALSSFFFVIIIAECNQYLISQYEERVSLSVSHANYTYSGAEEAIIYKEYFSYRGAGCWLSYSNYQWIQVRIYTPYLWSIKSLKEMGVYTFPKIAFLIFFYCIVIKQTFILHDYRICHL